MIEDEDDGDEKELPPLKRLSASAMRLQEPTPREWVVPGLVPDKAITILYADGGLGKSLLTLQLCLAVAAGRPWLGIECAPRPTLFITTEDDNAEIVRRFHDICDHYGLPAADLAAVKMDAISLVDEPDVAIAREDLVRRGGVSTTDLYIQIIDAILESNAGLVVLDAAADMAAFEENNRALTHAFMHRLRQTCITLRTAVLIVAHVSLSGRGDGGRSGSTGWVNKARSRLFLQQYQPDVPMAPGLGEEPAPAIAADTDLRLLSCTKANYGARTDGLVIRWLDGAFVPEMPPAPDVMRILERRTNNDQARRIFLDLLAEYNRSGMTVCDRPSQNFAPTVFAKRREAQGVTKHDLTAAMNELQRAGLVIATQVRRDSKMRNALVLTEEGQQEQERATGRGARDIFGSSSSPTLPANAPPTSANAFPPTTSANSSPPFRGEEVVERASANANADHVGGDLNGSHHDPFAFFSSTKH